MNRIQTKILSVFAVSLASLWGCSQPSAPDTPPAATAPESAEKEPSGLAKLSDEDRKAALEQEICPVTGEKLGSMGAPPKVVVDGREVFLCCAGCEEELRKDPEKYLAKLKKD